MLHRTLKLPKARSFFLFGARQVGKSTLLRQLFSKNHSIFINLLDSEVYFKLLAKPHLLIEEINTLDKSISHLIIDEIQRVPELLNIVHKMIEERKDISFILSGSSARKLKRQGANMLAGRALTYNLFPLTHLELAKDFKLSRALDLGTLPAVYLDKEDVFARETLKSYARTYIEEEIKAEAQIRQLGAFIRFLDLAASENGSIINYSNIASDIYVDYKTVQEYYQVLEDTLIGFSLYGYAKSSRKQLSKHPKFYFFDTGVRRALAKKLDSPLIVKTREFGEAFEHFFIAEAMRLASYSRKDYKFSYYRTKSGAEVDLIIET
jgi:predicted AAA+ superfamily ATPase